MIRLVIRGVNPEPWAIGTVNCYAKGRGTISPNPKVVNYQLALREELLQMDLPPVPLPLFPQELRVLYWRSTERGQPADVTNLNKATEDALQGILYQNDVHNFKVTGEIMEQHRGVEHVGLIIILDDYHGDDHRHALLSEEIISQPVKAFRRQRLRAAGRGVPVVERTAPKHPAPFSPTILAELRSVVDQLAPQFDRLPVRILDPMAGIGTIHRLQSPFTITTTGLEIEPEWAAQHPDTLEGDATDMPFGKECFEMIVTSPPYGNRMADQFVSKDGTKRITYYHFLGRRLHENSSAGMQFGPEYCKTMRDILVECKRVLVPDGVFVLNISDFIRAGKVVPVVQFYLNEMVRLKYKVIMDRSVPTPRMRYGTNHRVRVESERVIVFRKRS